MLLCLKCYLSPYSMQAAPSVSLSALSLSLSRSISSCSLQALQIYDSAFFSLSLSLSALSHSFSSPFALHSLLLKFAHFVLHMLHVYDFVLYPNKSAEYMEINEQYNTQIVLYTLQFNESACVCACVSNETLQSRKVA